VFANNYHLREDSLIFSARMNDKRLETVEFSLSRMEVVQSRGLCNQNTEYHEQIIALVNQNKHLIRERLTA
ncbi:MAG: PcfJ domain-containing protein, partial [Bacteroidales bacterium]